MRICALNHHRGRPHAIPHRGARGLCGHVPPLLQQRLCIENGDDGGGGGGHEDDGGPVEIGERGLSSSSRGRGGTQTARPAAAPPLLAGPGTLCSDRGGGTRGRWCARCRRPPPSLPASAAATPRGPLARGQSTPRCRRGLACRCRGLAEQLEHGLLKVAAALEDGAAGAVVQLALQRAPQRVTIHVPVRLLAAQRTRVHRASAARLGGRGRRVAVQAALCIARAAQVGLQRRKVRDEHKVHLLRGAAGDVIRVGGLTAIVGQPKVDEGGEVQVALRGAPKGSERLCGVGAAVKQDRVRILQGNRTASYSGGAEGRKGLHGDVSQESCRRGCPRGSPDAVVRAHFFS